MQTQPKIVERRAQPYVAMRRVVSVPFSDMVDATLPLLWQWLEAHQVEPQGPPFFKYNRLSAGEMEIEFGVPTATLLPAAEGVVTGTLPAGRYAMLTHHGNYSGLREVNASLVDWLDAHGHAQDVEVTPEGELFACRLEIYPNDPREVPDPNDWETVLAFRLRD